MDLDALSGVIAYKHTGDSVTTVTAAVDRITINHPLKELCDLELSGQVTYATGRSSMEISLQVAKAPNAGSTVNKEDVLMTCAFTMVSLDPSTKKPVAVNPIKLETEEEKRLFGLGQKNSTEKKALAKKTLRKQAPNDEESDLIHAMWLKQLEYHGMFFYNTVPFAPLLTRFNRSQSLNSKARKRSLHGQNPPAIVANNAASIPQPAQFHDLWWFPPQTDFRARFLLRGCVFSFAADIR